MTTGLVKYDAACRAIAAAKTVVEAKRIGNNADLWRAYAKQAKNRDLEVDCAEIRIRAERRVGELIGAQKAGFGLNRGTAGKGRPVIGGTRKAPPKDLPTLTEAGIDKKLSARAQQLARVAPPQFEALILEWRGRVQAETERVTLNLLRAGERRPPHEPPAWPVGQFRLLYVDPPWEYEHIVTESRAIANQYPTLTLDAICALTPPAAPDAVLFLWATSPKLAEAFQVLQAWDFSYRTCAVWDKEIVGMGYYFRQQHELLLVAARGAAPVPEPSDRPASVFRVRRGRHSAKPQQVYELLEAMYPTLTAHDRVELFARQPRAGWTVWGNEPETEAAS
jgi:N6-adenosine-specific RNA methylase IME4